VPEKLRLKGVAKSYGATRALVDVSLEVGAGEVHCLLGENGAGKSTLGKVVGGLVRPDAGTMVWRGRPLAPANAHAARAAGIAVVHQELSLAPDLTVRENLWLGSEPTMLGRIRHGEERTRAVTMLASLGLALDPERRTGDLAAAEQQLIEVGKALMPSPRLVVFDEPTAMLGAAEKRRLFDVLRRLRGEGVAVVLVTHHIEDVMEVGDRVSVMRNGELVDSFPLDGIDANGVLERLTGRKRRAADEHLAPLSAAAVLRIDNVPQRGSGPLSILARAGEVIGFYGVVGCGADRIVRGAVGEHDARPIAYRLRDRPFRPRSAAAALAAGVAYLPAGRTSNCILPARSICENMTIGKLRRFSRLGALDLARERADAQRTLAEYQVKFGDLNDPITSLSGGNQQKVLLARAIGAAREVLVLEEPTAGVDIESKTQIHRLVRQTAAAGTTVLLLSSDLGEAVALCNVIYTMYGGSIVGAYANPRPDDQPAILFDVLGRSRDHASYACSDDA
jgi:ribose transport system ATP-binding protein